MSRSEVAALRQRLTEECEAGWQALYGLSEGVAKHEIIAAKFRNMEVHHQHLTELVGENQATEILCQIYNDIGNAH